ncbi:helix-turn-helix domain-containing protein [Terriglobus sp. TAA 43]|uniref:helix-turn-helix transcriptional regulator n=1 Tax=Terriglobus sp. TAA 43 TaxID=278961 RepID=UPI00064693BD
MDNQAIEKPLTAEQLAAVLQLNPETIRRWARESKIPCVRLSPRKIVFLPSKIRAWLEARNGYTDDAGRVASTETEKAA